MKTVYKYRIGVKDVVTISLPKEAEILSIQMQSNELYLWALVDTENALEDRYIEVFGTGQGIYSDVGIERKYITTVQQSSYVWHIFERLG